MQGRDSRTRALHRRKFRFRPASAEHVSHRCRTKTSETTESQGEGASELPRDRAQPTFPTARGEELHNAGAMGWGLSKVARQPQGQGSAVMGHQTSVSGVVGWKQHCGQHSNEPCRLQITDPALCSLPKIKLSPRDGTPVMGRICPLKS